MLFYAVFCFLYTMKALSVAVRRKSGNMASNNMSTTIIATMTTEQQHCRSRASDKMLDMSRDNSPMLGNHGNRDYNFLYPGLQPLSVPSPLSSNGCLKICVSGRVFELTLDQVKRYPDSLLADPDKMAEYYLPALGMFFFDRNRYVFEHIMQFYQTSDGYMEFPDDIPCQLLEIELDFYKIGHRSIKRTEESEEEPVLTVWDKGRRFFNDPGFNVFAKSWMALDIFFIIISVITFVLKTEDVIQLYEEQHYELHLFFWVTTIFCAVFFTVDLGGRLVFCKNKYRFFLEMMPWLDIIAIIPLYVEIFERYLDLRGDLLNILKLFRMARVARCLKLIRRSKKLILIFQILRECKEELSLLLLVWATGTLISGSIMFYVEERANSARFYSILESCWWAITTIGTIGYGNIRPVTAVGLFLTTAIIFCSMIFMTVPMTIIIRRFSDSYEKVERLKTDVKLFGTAPLKTSSWSVSDGIPSLNNNSWAKINDTSRSKSSRF
ncbi:potassium voltage-gated channel subfamily A member 6-like [Bolinopsis microptera]|uniref:potassium voltage-gated channel subfamily A member 6-like n=1 Tax=Bolinopsis microptera TaxID=2820187 RepID=UPI003079064B